jgi:hypothetical protein
MKFFFFAIKMHKFGEVKVESTMSKFIILAIASNLNSRPAAHVALAYGAESLSFSFKFELHLLTLGMN